MARARHARPLFRWPHPMASRHAATRRGATKAWREGQLAGYPMPCLSNKPGMIGATLGRNVAVLRPIGVSECAAGRVLVWSRSATAATPPQVCREEAREGPPRWDER